MTRRPTILVADDDCDVRRAVRAKLRWRNYSVIEAASGSAVLDKCRAGPIDAYILDHELPAGNGRDIARELRRVCDVPIIFLSGHDREQFRSITHDLPDVYFLAKPLDGDRLLALLEELLESPPAQCAAAARDA